MITEIWNSSVPGCFFPILMQHYDDFINYMFWISKAQILANRDGGQPPIPTTLTFPKPQKYTRDKKWNFMQYCICIYNLTVSISHELSLLKIYTVLNLFKWFFYGRPTFSQTDTIMDSLIALDTGNTDQEAECMKRSVICMLEA